MRRSLALLSLPLFGLIAACAPVPEPLPPAPPVPVPVPPPAARPAPAPAPAPSVSSDWRDWPLAPGDWVYRRDARGSIALFGPPGADAEATLRCDRLQRRIFFSRRDSGAAPATLVVRTSSTMRSLSALPTGGAPGYVAVPLDVNDTLLEAMGFSRGQFVVERAGQAPLVLPAWPEILRVAEDCRGGAAD